MTTLESLKQFLEPFTRGHNGYVGFTRAFRSEDPDNNKNWESYKNYYCPVSNGVLDFSYIEDELLEFDTWEWYFTPAVLSSNTTRKQDDFEASNVIWIDFDIPVSWAEFDLTPSLVVETSPLPKVHCYWFIDEPITNPYDMKYWNQKFLEYFNDGDKSGCDATQLLKLPWGFNLKLESRIDGEPFPPEAVSEFSHVFSMTEFSHVPEPTVAIQDIEIPGSSEMPECEDPWSMYLVEFSDKLPSHVAKKLSTKQPTDNTTRSEITYNLILELHSLLKNKEDVFSLMQGSPNDHWTADFGPQKGPYRLWEDICRVVAKNPLNPTSSWVAEIKTLYDAFKGREVGEKVTQYVIKELKEYGKFVQSDQGEYYFVDQNSGFAHMYGVNKDTASPFAGFVRRSFGLLAGSDSRVLSDIFHDAITECQREEPVSFYKFSTFNRLLNKLYVDRYDGSMYVLDGETVKHKSYGYDEVYFYPKSPNDKFPEPFEYVNSYKPGGLSSLILNGPNYLTVGHGIPREAMMHVVETWILGLFFPELLAVKPNLVFFGGPDSGKSSIFQNLSILFTGDETHSVTDMPATGREFDNVISNNTYIFYDNVEVMTNEQQLRIAQTSTGRDIKMRKYYTTNDIMTFKAKCFSGISTTTLDKVKREVAERFIVMPVRSYSEEEQKGNRIPLSLVWQRTKENRDKLWSELLDKLNILVGYIAEKGFNRREDCKIRLTDYGSLLGYTCNMRKTDKQEGRSFNPSRLEEFIVRMQDDIVYANDPLFDAIDIFMEKSGNQTPELKSTDLRIELGRINKRVLGSYKHAKSLTSTLLNNRDKGLFSRKGIRVNYRKIHNASYFQFEKEPEE